MDLTTTLVDPQLQRCRVSENDPNCSTYSTNSGCKGAKNKLPNFEGKLQSLLTKLISCEVTEFKCRPKNIKKCFKNKSKRRSRFIGVSKNGNSWQVLINVRNQKKYIGGYPDEKEAAIAYDFYTMVLRGKDAKTNFDYEREVVIDMINDYLKLGNTFEPSRYVNRVATPCL